MAKQSPESNSASADDALKPMFATDEQAAILTGLTAASALSLPAARRRAPVRAAWRPGPISDRWLEGVGGGTPSLHFPRRSLRSRPAARRRRRQTAGGDCPRSQASLGRGAEAGEQEAPAEWSKRHHRRARVVTARNSPGKPTRAQGRHPRRRQRKDRPALRWTDLANLLSEVDPRFDELKAQMLRSLEQLVHQAEARLNKLIDAQAREGRSGFRLITRGRTALPGGTL